MKILHMLTTLTYGGIETMITNMVNIQSKYADLYMLIINQDVSPTLIDNISDRVKIIRFNRRPRSEYIKTVLRINYLLLKINPDIIHIHVLPLIKTIPLFWRKKTCCTVHGIMNFDKNLYSYKHVFSVSETTKDYLNKYNISSSVVYNGIPTHVFNTKSTYSLTKTFRIVNIGRLLIQIKRQDILVEAAYILKCRGINNIRIDIIGEGESAEELKTKVKGLELEDIIRFSGNHTQEYIHKHLCEYDLLVNCSYSESFGLTVAEGMAAKIPVLISSNTGACEVIKNGEYGYIFENGNAADCADKIAKIMTLTNTEINNKTNAALDYVRATFDINVTAKKYLDEYSKII